MPHPATMAQGAGPRLGPHLERLLEFTEPHADDVCLDVARGDGPMPAALGPQVRHVTSVNASPPARRSEDGRMSTVTFGTRVPDDEVDGSRPAAPSSGDQVAHRGSPDATDTNAAALPYDDNSFSLVTAHFSLYSLGDPKRVLRELLRVCRPGGRIVIADLVRGNLAAQDRDRIERLRDPRHPGTPSIACLTELITTAGASIRRLDVFTVERPLEPWLATADPHAADQIRTELLDEVDGGPKTGAKPRLIGGELWFTQSWAYVAAEPI
ncbi:class I SAM-dependent methyltransferase [Spirillospora sp. CA-294931]|uniref:class I SAM-dependent methyltransferase n=1 Tax=Spirillospora sp. CA-294931 TaxID=3240042 RepID=UPI003D94F84B